MTRGGRELLITGGQSVDSRQEPVYPAKAPVSSRHHPIMNPETKPDLAIVGMGYVGLPLALQFARSGSAVLGLDIDAGKVETITAGRSCIKNVTSAEIEEMAAAGRFAATSNFARVSEVEAVIICVPTPLNKNREPDISYVLHTGRAIAPYLSEGMVVVLESTTYPGTTDGDLRRVLEEGSGLRAGVDFHLAYSPERQDSGNDQSTVKTVPKVIGGLTPRCLERAMAVYGRAIDTLVPVSSCRVAEASKLLENIFRSVNIALINEMKVVYEAMGVDVWEVIAAAKSKPFGFMPFYPGPGPGGHCIPIAPFFLTWKAREFGQHTRFIELAGEINAGMPERVVHRVTSALNDRGLAVKGSRILILGLAYKPNVDDHRESPGFVLFDLLTAMAAEVEYHDPFIPVIQPTREYSHYAGKVSVAWTRETIGGFDLVLIATNHSSVNYRELAEWAPCIVDTRNAMAGVETRPGQVWKA